MVVGVVVVGARCVKKTVTVVAIIIITIMITTAVTRLIARLFIIPQ
jgi:hypothetical protein